MNISPLAGKTAPTSILVNIAKLVTAYYSVQPDPSVVAQQVSFGTSGHRGSAFDGAFNEWHILAITQAICDYRQTQKIDGPLFIGIDTHALSEPAFSSAVEVLAANGVETMVSQDTPYTPTPVVSHAILSHNKRSLRLRERIADGIVITPSHNPPDDGGFKYDPPHGGPADSKTTGWIQSKANDYLRAALAGVKRMPAAKALAASTTRKFDYLTAYVNDLGSVIDFAPIRDAKIRLGVDPLGGASVAYWPRIAEKFGLNLTVVNETVDSTFRFMTVDWDGKVRMDPSSQYAMAGLIGLKDKFDVAFACDTDADRHGVVTKSTGLLPPNHYLSVCIDYLFSDRKEWGKDVAVGKTVVSSSMIDRVTKRLGRQLYEAPVGFKWFVEGLLSGKLGFGGEESAGASFLRRDGTTWTTDKDGLIAALLSAEITARTGKDPGEAYRAITRELGDPVYERVDAKANLVERTALGNLSPADVHIGDMAGQKVERVLTNAPGDGNAIGGIKVMSRDGWFAARPSGTEEIYKIYAESFLGREHLVRIEEEAQKVVSDALAASGSSAARA